MTYNPLFDLAVGLFLILVPIVVLSGLLYILLFQQPQNPKTEGRPNSLREWIRESLEEAKSRRDVAADEKSEIGREEMDRLVALLDELKNRGSMEADKEVDVDPSESIESEPGR